MDDNKLKKHKILNIILMPLFILFAIITLLNLFLDTFIISIISGLLTVIIGIIIIICTIKNSRINSNKPKTEKQKKIKNVAYKKKNVKSKKIKEIKAKKQIINIKTNQNYKDKILKELKLKKIIYYVFFSFTCIFLIISIFLTTTIILSMFIYPILIPTIVCSIITIIIHNDIKQIKFQLFLDEIINHRDSN